MYLKKLDDSQTINFNTEYVNGARWIMVESCIEKYFPDGNFNFVDLGGGNGSFSDRILQSFPNSHAILIDNSEYLLYQNKSNLRKTIICDSLENTNKYIKSTNIVFYNWTLHHLVSNSYNLSRKNIAVALRIAKSLIQENGYISIFENMYNGIYFNNMPSHIIFALTSNKLLSPLIRKLGANTAGCGVCFLSKKQWDET